MAPGPRKLDPRHQAILDIYPDSEWWRAKVWGLSPSQVYSLWKKQHLAVLEAMHYTEQAAKAPPPPVPLPDHIHPNQLQLEI